MKTAKILISITVLFLTTQLYAWGGKAHDVIVDIAEKNLTPKAKAEVNRLLNGKSMVYYAKWMDDIRSDSTYDFTRTWHWLNVDSGQTIESMPKVETGDILSATDLTLQKLTSKTENDSIKRMYLKFLIHLIGDMHCPLHAGRATDRGGNNYRITWFGNETDIHTLWDGKLLESARTWSYSEWSLNLMLGLTSTDIARMQTGTPKEWFTETVVLADQIYKSTPQNENLRFRYIYTHSKIVEQQLTLGGYRLAYVLNTIFNSP
jgi:hypothetical protein